MTMLITEAVSGIYTDMDSTRLDISPYAAPSAVLQLQDASRLYVPDHLLVKSPKLSSPDENGIYHLDMPHEVAHVVVHYLFTDTYQCLRPKGSSLNEKLIAEFLTSIRVYIVARDYKLPLLEELAQAEITRLGSGFRIPLVFDLVQEAYPHPSLDDTWLRQYLKSRLSILFTDPKELLEWDPAHEPKTTTISDILLKNILELLRDNILSSHKLTNGTPETSQAGLTQEDSVPVKNIEPLKSAEPETIELDTDRGSVKNGVEVKTTSNNTNESFASTVGSDIHIDKNGIDTDKNGIDTNKIDTILDKNGVDLVNDDNDMGKIDNTTNKSDDELTRNGTHTPVSKSGSCEPESPKGDNVLNGLDQKVKGTEERLEGKDFWGLSLKKKKKKKAAKGLIPEPLQEGVAVKT
ncbi:hypothetical protein N5P37_011159 [Trichoderma harzianum]|uniref:BTB domain-containing protein n=1 Tax=Trichoderma harzianum CBS 226.95 TaxID=983964 RepID=A0A2T3ZW23_TRIHA|nr:hypothetical protein M431DRAFT_98683 [Trichoderma harzianum CBS 226.95]KAK0756244.1 hypothetical protein N5P37_011159 [Trichoderma harzianum]PKK54276.1 hypothetical protein CI102_1746 [Trichoderma harzianum]PTB49011.1 hypothetical protein M431DRAFT_98683 [Trichoderma harzianum CBS 226.95]